MSKECRSAQDLSKDSSKNPSKNSLDVIAKLIETVHRLRAPDGCAWDRAQTHQSLRPYLIEEAYEVLDVLDRIESPNSLKNEQVKGAFSEELGDLLMQVLLHSEMASEVQAFDIYDVARGLDEKLIRRHPHVFGDQKAENAEVALKNWEVQKAKEKATQREAALLGSAGLDTSILSGVPKGLPALQRASRVIEKVTKVGFQWKDLSGPIAKVEEEWKELRHEIECLQKAPVSEERKSLALRKKVEGELGDLLFTVCNLATYLKMSPEDALRGALSKFESRFKYIEECLHEKGKTPAQSNLEEMDRFWDEAKEIEATPVFGLTGGVASGKSTASRIFEAAGIPVIRADELGRQITDEHPGVKAFLEGRVGKKTREELRALVFADASLRKELESLLYPLIQAATKKRIRELKKSGAPFLIYESALLVEKGRAKDFAGLILVECPQELRKSRLMERTGMTEALAQSIFAAQASGTVEDERRSLSQFRIENSGSLSDLEKQVRALIGEIQVSLAEVASE